MVPGPNDPLHAEHKKWASKFPTAEVEIPSSQFAQPAEPRGGKRKTKKFKKHYMWNTKGKRYMAKTHKQHMRGVKLGHTHKKPKKSSRRTKKRGRV
jgi:UDP-2,3-diacylglucosamine pyrophosphatase LpxH